MVCLVINYNEAAGSTGGCGWSGHRGEPPELCASGYGGGPVPDALSPDGDAPPTGPAPFRPAVPGPRLPQPTPRILPLRRGRLLGGGAAHSLHSRGSTRAARPRDAHREPGRTP